MTEIQIFSAPSCNHCVQLFPKSIFLLAMSSVYSLLSITDTQGQGDVLWWTIALRITARHGQIKRLQNRWIFCRQLCVVCYLPALFRLPTTATTATANIVRIYRLPVWHKKGVYGRLVVAVSFIAQRSSVDAIKRSTRRFINRSRHSSLRSSISRLHMTWHNNMRGVHGTTARRTGS